MTHSSDRIGRQLRRLRQARGWSQAELARRLHLSQPRLSEIERGRLSLTAEEFLDVLKLFNVPATDFADSGRATSSQLLNALERLGAHHLRENPDVLPSDVVKEASSVVREVLVGADSPRHITGLASVLVVHADDINFEQLLVQLNEIGLSRRLGWLLENTVEAIQRELSTRVPKQWQTIYRRALGILNEALLRAEPPERLTPTDILDRTIRSAKTLREIADEASHVSVRWNIATAIQVDDFVQVLRASRARH